MNEATVEHLTENPLQSLDFVSPGAQLREAREVAGLSMKDIADYLRLGVGVIQAIELDDYASISSRVYCYGYLRAYANLLKIDVQRIVDAFNALDLSKEKTTEETFSFAKPMQSSLKWLRWVGVALLVGGFLFGGFWWQSHSVTQLAKETVLAVQNEAEV